MKAFQPIDTVPTDGRIIVIKTPNGTETLSVGETPDGYDGPLVEGIEWRDYIPDEWTDK